MYTYVYVVKVRVGSNAHVCLRRAVLLFNLHVCLYKFHCSSLSDLENWNGTDRFHFNAIVTEQDLVEVIFIFYLHDMLYFIRLL